MLEPLREDPEFERVDDVLGIVEDDPQRREPFRRFVAKQRTPQRVEAIRLGGRPRRAADHQPYAGILLRNLRDGGDRRRIIGIGADIDRIIGMIEPAQRGAQHPADHLRLIPRRDEYRDSARRNRLHGFRR